jgi:putative glycosyl hydrolase
LKAPGRRGRLALAGLAAASLVVGSAIHPTVGSESFVFGINGHPLMQAAYSSETPVAEEQFDLLDSLLVRWYRVDVIPDSTGVVDQRFVELARAATGRGINLLPVLTVGPRAGASPTAAYAEGLAIGGGFARRYGQWFSHLEAGNEMDKWPLASGSGGDGSSLPQYDADTLAVVTAFLRGMSRGIRHSAPQVSIIINSAGWRHWAFFDALERDSVDYDLVGYHWYSEMGDIDQPIDGGKSALDHLYDLNKDIWITEVGHRPTNPDDPHDQGRWIADCVADFYGFSRVKALFVYELYEQRDFLANSDTRDDPEGLYGVVRCPDDPSGCGGAKRPKPAFLAYRRAISERSIAR